MQIAIKFTKENLREFNDGKTEAVRDHDFSLTQPRLT